MAQERGLGASGRIAAALTEIQDDIRARRGRLPKDKQAKTLPASEAKLTAAPAGRTEK